MKKALSMGAFTELDKQEIINMQGGYYIPVTRFCGIKINYSNPVDEITAVGWIAGGAVGGGIAGSISGPVGAALGAYGGAVTGTIGTEVGDVASGKATVSFSILGF